MKETAENQEEKAFRARRLICHYQERIKASRDRIFPLLCPTEEYKWIDEWECELVYSESGVVEDNCIFREEMSPRLFGLSGPATWITTLHDPVNYRVHFVVLNDELVRKGETSIEDEGDGVSTVRWTSAVTSLNERGNQAFEEVEERLQLGLRFLAMSLRHYCETGEMLKRSEFSLSQETR